MRFVALKSEEQQARGVLFRTRELLIRQRTQMINALRGHLAEFGFIVPKGSQNVRLLSGHIENFDNDLFYHVREAGIIYLDQIERLTERVNELEISIKAEAKRSDTSRRLETIPGIGPITAMAIEAFAPEMNQFEKGRNFSAWLGLVPKQNSTGGKQRLGRTSKMGQKDIRRLLIMGAMSVIVAASKKGGAPKGSWLSCILIRKPLMVVAIALANKMARTIWAMLTKGEDYRNPMLEIAA